MNIDTTIEDTNVKVDTSTIKELAASVYSDKQTSEVQEELIDESYLIESQRKALDHNNNYFRLMCSLLMCASFGVIAYFLAFSSSKISDSEENLAHKGNEKQQKQLVFEDKQAREDKLQAEIAMSQQKDDFKQEPQPVMKVEEVEEVEDDSVEKTSTDNNYTPVAQQNSIEPVQEVKESIDPLQRWEELAALGMEGSTSISPPIQSISASENNQIPQAVPASYKEADSSTYKPVVNTNNSENSQKDNEILSVSIGDNQDNLWSNEEQKLNDLGLNNQEVIDFLSDSSFRPGSYLAKKTQEYKAQDKLTQSTTPTFFQNDTSSKPQNKNFKFNKFENNLDCLDNSSLAGERRRKCFSYSNSNNEDYNAKRSPTEQEKQITSTADSDREDKSQIEQYIPVSLPTSSLSKSTYVDRGSPTNTNSNISISPDVSNVPFGSTTKGVFEASIYWSEDADSKNSRSKITLTEPLFDENGKIALDEGSILIVEIDSIGDSGLVNLNVVAVSYIDNQGNLKQEKISSEAISIRGKDNKPLIADHINDGRKLLSTEDLLIGLLGAGEEGFKNLNEPTTRTMITESLGSNIYNDLNSGSISDRVTSFSRREPNLLHGAAEGIFDTTKERLERKRDESQNTETSKTPIYKLDEGEEVYIFVNSFLEVNK